MICPLEIVIASRRCIWPLNPSTALNLWRYATSPIASMSYESAFSAESYIFSSITNWRNLSLGFLSQSVQMGNTTMDFVKKKGIYTQGNTYSRWIVRSHWNNQMKGNVFEYIGGIVYSKRCTCQSVSGSQLAKISKLKLEQCPKEQLISIEPYGKWEHFLSLWF
jgi:hypothetical protein